MRPPLLCGFRGSFRALTPRLDLNSLSSLEFRSSGSYLPFHLRFFGRRSISAVGIILWRLPGLSRVESPSLLLYLTVGRWGVWAAAFAILSRPAVQTVLLGLRLGGIRLPRRTPVLREAWRRARPLLAGSLLTKSEPLVDRSLSSFASQGELTHLHLAMQVYGSGQTVLARAITAPMVTRLSKLAEQGRWREFEQSMRRSLVTVGVISLGVLVVVGLAFATAPGLRPSIGRFRAQDFQIVLRCMVALGGFSIAGALGQILSSTYYCLGDTRTPTLIGLFGFTVGLIGKIVGLTKFGIVGLATGTSVAWILNIPILILGFVLC